MEFFRFMSYFILSILPDSVADCVHEEQVRAFGGLPIRIVGWRHFERINEKQE